ncbi:hypothetical protein [Bernardetia sp.]|uniref:hypothetical protein n=1 Tax=Bernardetia sp. TaxID=1937974 RepID=UPI0025C49322|nr:hypothetical protein [Bernardetia sp.]
MNIKKLNYCLLIVLCIFTFSCKQEQKKEETEQVEVTQTEEVTQTIEEDVEETKPTNDLTIYQNSFLGLSPDTKITDYAGTLEKGLLQTGEGDFDIYNIKDKEGNTTGYFTPFGEMEDSVGIIVVTSELAQTEDGIKIGDTFQTLLEKYPNLEVFGSEIEGYTQAVVGRLGYRLDEQHYNYELKPSEIKKDTKIIEITIR